MPPKRKSKHKTSVSAEEKAERRRNALQRYYLQHPEVREKNRLHAAEKKVAAQERRRRWDPPKQVRCDVTNSARPSTPPTEHGNNDLENDHEWNTSTPLKNQRTTAEHVAAQALTEMAQATPEDEDGDDSILALANRLSSLGDSDNSFDSILVRVNQLSALTSDSSGSTLSVDIAPLKLSAMDSLGEAVPVATRPTGARFSHESTWAFGWEQSGRDLTPSRRMLSVEHWDEVAGWAREVGRAQDNGWDAAVYWEFCDIAIRLTETSMWGG
ncbi:hypothetical protein C8R44DRAFT_736577 [Mycena epipterygia]|nr:hypothetical protein C8R44DRAFT_736577 [Mycena epipterygia]